VDACEKLTDEGKDLSLLLVGDGPEHDAIRQRVRDKGLDSRTTFTGFVDHEQVPAYISSCDILYGVVDPDHWGSPMKVFEYLACGRPVVAYGSPGIDFVGRIGAGCLVDAVSRSTVVTALSQLIEASPERRAKMGAVGRSYVLDNHTWAAYADRIVDAITDSR
jgi:glycosyltransferase involved in cell wall biosynthesis